MAISIDWGTRVISVPKADMTLVQSSPYEIRELDIDVFRLALRDLEDDPEGMSYPHTHNHVSPISVGGVTLARVVELINNYTVTFENGTYAVNLVGANSNISDKTNLNTVQVRSANSAGLVQIISGSGLSTEQDQRLQDIETRVNVLPDAATVADSVWDEPAASHVAPGTFGESMSDLLTLQGDLLLDIANLNDPSATEIADAVWNATAAAYVTNGTMGKELVDAIVQVGEVYQIQGLESGTPMTVTQTSRTAGSISLAITGDGVTTSTVTRS